MHAPRRQRAGNPLRSDGRGKFAAHMGVTLRVLANLKVTHMDTRGVSGGVEEYMCVWEGVWRTGRMGMWGCGDLLDLPAEAPFAARAASWVALMARYNCGLRIWSTMWYGQRHDTVNDTTLCLTA